MHDCLADVFTKVRDATVCNSEISNAEKVAVLELVKAEIVRHMQQEIDNA